MRTQIISLLVIILFAFLITACDRPACNNTNPVFDQFSPESPYYKAELARQLEIADPSKLTWWFNQYVESNEKEVVLFNVRDGNGLCAVMVLNVEDWGKMENVRNKKGKSYRGAQFTNLTFEVRQDSATTDFIYLSHDKIID